MGSATNAIIGMMMLWWAWIAFNQVTSASTEHCQGRSSLSFLGRHVRDQRQAVDGRHPRHHHLHPRLLRGRHGGARLQPPHQEGEDGRDVGLQRDPGRAGQRDGRLCKFPPEIVRECAR